MKLIYRGTTYNYNPDKAPGRPFQQVREAGSAYNLTYRGVTYRVDPNSKSAEVPIAPAAYKLIYRGITYFVNSTAQGEVTAVTQPAKTLAQVPSPSLLNQHIQT
jgi:YHS domain-containing protein